MDDYALALQLQEEFDTEATLSASQAGGSGLYTGQAHAYAREDTEQSEMSLVDPQWEVLDPNPDIRVLFLQYNERFFWGRLAGIEVKWSPRMTLCAGLCVYEGKGGLCSVRLSLPLLKLRPRKDLVETLLHEMIHAYLFVTDNNKDHDGHGPEFHKHMYRINKETGTNISVYHNFHDEVDSYRQHWWRCDGTCRSKPPYFGYVKRSMNRAPSARDPWWPAHQATCGGTYTKVKEPEGYGQKKSKKNKEESKTADKAKGKGNKDIRDLFWSTGGSVAGPSLSGSSTSTSKDKDPRSHLPGFSELTDEEAALFCLDSDDDFDDWPSQKSSSSQPGHLEKFDETTDKKNVTYKEIEPFSKPGVTLSLNQPSGSSGDVGKPGELANVRIRKIPGIGIISSERPVEASRSNNIDLLGQANSSRMEISSEGSESASSSKTIEMSNNRKDLPKDKDEKVINTDKSCHGKSVKYSGSIHDWLKNNRTPPGTSVKIKGFKSVSNKSSSPIDMNIPKRKDLTPVKKYCPTPSASNRNSRAHDLSNTDSDTDEEENQTLLSSVMNKRNKNSGVDKKRQISTSSSMSVPDDKRLRVESGSNTVNNNDVCLPTTQRIPDDPLQTCPVCEVKVKASLINNHLDMCLS